MAGKDKLYQFLIPIGLQYPVNTLPLAPRPSVINGKEIYFSITGDPDVTLPFETRFRSDYRPIKWKVKKPYMLAPAFLEEEMKTADGQIQGVAW